MGRHHSGIVSTGEVTRISISNLIKRGLIKKDSNIKSRLSWTDGSSIGFESYYHGEIRYINLSYRVTRHDTGKVYDMECRICLTTIPSNLGKGEVMYFLCPYTGNMARILYQCYGSNDFRSRKTYWDFHHLRIYYSSQLSSKLSYLNDRYWAYARMLEAIKERRMKSHYQGKQTRLLKKIERLEDLQAYYDNRRFYVMPSFMLKMIPSIMKNYSPK